MKYRLGAILSFYIMLTHAACLEEGTVEEREPLLHESQRIAVDLTEQDDRAGGLLWSKADWAQATNDLRMDSPIPKKRLLLVSLWQKLRCTKTRVTALEDTVAQQKDEIEALSGRVIKLELYVDDLLK